MTNDTTAQEANAMSEAPERIWLQADDGNVPDLSRGCHTCGCATKPIYAENEGVRYVRADLYDDQAKAIKAAQEALENLLGYFDTPIVRRKAGFQDVPQWLADARATLAALQESSHD